MRGGDLLPGERVLLTARQHRVVLVRPFALTPVAVLVVVVALLLMPLRGELRLFFALAALLIGVLILNLYYWRWRAHEYVVTDQRVILNEGVLARFSRSIAIDRIQDLTGALGTDLGLRRRRTGVRRTRGRGVAAPGAASAAGAQRDLLPDRGSSVMVAGLSAIIADACEEAASQHLWWVRTSSATA